MRILITGAAGFIGSHLVERLAGLGHQVRGIDCLTDYYARALKKSNVDQLSRAGVAMLPLDLAEDDLRPAVQDVDLVYHAAAQPGISSQVGFETYMRNNLIATQRLLEAIKESPALKGFIYVSTSSVYGADATGDEESEPRPTSHYGVTKLAAEQLVLALAREEGFPGSSLRLFSVYGPRERPEKLYPRLIGAILEGRPFPLFEGSERHLRSYTYVSDIIDGMVAVAGNLDACVGEIFNLGTDVAMTTGEGVRCVEAIIGRQAKIEYLPPRPGDQLRTHAHIEKAARVLGYQPRTTLRAGLERSVAWYEEQILGKVDLWPNERR